jgi:glycosyltransferase involved in cell wall biosynthesis
MSLPLTSNPTPATTTPSISVVIPACNAGMRHFETVLKALRDQTLPKNRWELIVVDDASRVPLRAARRDGHEARGEGREAERSGGGSLVASSESAEDLKPTNLKLKTHELDLGWHPNARLVQTDPEREGGGEKADTLKIRKAENEGACGEREGIGLVSARLRGFELGRGDVFVFVDQDNALRPDYLQRVADIAVEYPHIGTWGGQILLQFDEPDKAPDPWLRGALCTRELSDDVWTNVIDHHDSTPWGAGLCARREVLEIYRQRVLENPMRRLLDPTPRRAGFGGDSDLSYSGCRAGYGKGVFERLALDHLIPAGRCSDDYLLRNAETNGYSTVLHGFVEHGNTTPPRNDWRFWVMSWLRRPRRKRLEWEMEMAKRRGMWKAVAEISGSEGALRQYAEMLAAKADRLGE